MRPNTRARGGASHETRPPPLVSTPWAPRSIRRVIASTNGIADRSQDRTHPATRSLDPKMLKRPCQGEVRPLNQLSRCWQKGPSSGAAPACCSTPRGCGAALASFAPKAPPVAPKRAAGSAPAGRPALRAGALPRRAASLCAAAACCCSRCQRAAASCTRRAGHTSCCCSGARSEGARRPLHVCARANLEPRVGTSGARQQKMRSDGNYFPSGRKVLT